MRDFFFKINTDESLDIMKTTFHLHILVLLVYVNYSREVWNTNTPLPSLQFSPGEECLKV